MKISRRELIKLSAILHFSNSVSFARNNNLREDVIEIPILMYHDINPFKRDPYTVTPSQFASQMEFLYINGYSPILPSQIENIEMLIPRKPIIITFDDAYSSVLEYGFPYLKYYNFSFVLNVIGEHVGRYISFEDFNRPVLSWDELLYLKNSGLCEIGYHGYGIHFHGWVDKIDLLYFEKDLDIFFEKVKKFLSIETVNILAFPYGQYKETFIKVAVDKGFRYLLTSNEGVFKLNLTEKHRYLLMPRLNISYKLDLFSFKDYIGGR